MKKLPFYLFVLVLLLVNCGKESAVNDQTTVGIIAYKGISTEKVDILKKAITSYYGVTVIVLSPRQLPENAFINLKSPRYRADSLIAIQQRTISKDIDYILGLTESDISVTKHDKKGAIKQPTWRYNDFGIMGLAYCPGRSCVVSGFRLKNKDTKLHMERFTKVAIHELGHNFGLPHCPDKKCVMTDAVESIKTIDNANPALCNACQAKLSL